MIIREFKEGYPVGISYNNITIFNSHRIKSSKDMRDFLCDILKDDDVSEMLKHRTIKDMVSEWRVHNLLFGLGILVEKTCSVDFESYPNKYLKILYYVGSIFYPHW